MIPSTSEIRRTLLQELYYAPNHVLTAKEAYDKVEEYFEDVLQDEDHQPYHNSLSQFANKIQVVRKQLVDEGLIYSAKEYRHNQWKLTLEGEVVGRTFYEEAERIIGNIPLTEMISIPQELFIKLSFLEEHETFPEGKEKFALHSMKERSQKLVALKKKLAFDLNPLLPCEICGFSFKEKFGHDGEYLIEAHHIFPISDLTEETETKIEDLILVCSNCHTMIHRKRPWLTMEQIKNILIPT